MRARWTLLAAALVVPGATALGAWASARVVEERVARDLTREVAGIGLSARSLSFSWLGPLTLEGVTVESGPVGRLTIDEVRVAWGLAGGRPFRAHVRGLALGGVRLQRGALTVELPAADVDVLSWRGGAGEESIRLRQRASGGELEAQAWKTDDGARILASLAALDLSAARVSWRAEPVLVPGAWSGNLSVTRAPEHLATEGALAAEAMRLSLPRELGLGTGGYGAPIRAALAWRVLCQGHVVDVQRATAHLGGLELDGHGRLDGPADDRRLELEVAARTELAAALQTTALRLPASLAVGPADPLGTAWFDLAVRGPLARPAELQVVPHLRYDSAPQAVEKLQFLRRPFRYAPAATDGVSVDVREGAADFIPLAEVPPLITRAVLLSEDAGFYGHHGIDVAEIPAAWATNVERGTMARGASTITQQLVKNLFLAKDKSYGRKLEEAALALLVDAAVPKARILEIYLNVIEWGPGLYGLVPAARHYFGKRPAELTAKETAFLVCLIPSPVRYHQAHVAGHVGPGLEQIIDSLLARLRSVDALTEDAYAEALGEELRFRPEGAPPYS